MDSYYILLYMIIILQLFIIRRMWVRCRSIIISDVVNVRLTDYSNRIIPLTNIAPSFITKIIDISCTGMDWKKKSHSHIPKIVEIYVFAKLSDNGIVNYHHMASLYPILSISTSCLYIVGSIPNSWMTLHFPKALYISERFTTRMLSCNESV